MDGSIEGRGEARRQDPVGVGIVGSGFMGRTHAAAYAAAAEAGAANRLLGVFDTGAARRGGNTRDERVARPGVGEDDASPLERVPRVASYADLLSDPEVELVSICTPTETHVDLAIAALEAGKHVLLEKPVALASAEVQRLLEVERKSAGWCLPAMCMRFWPAWTWLLEVVANERFGAVESATFRRVGPAPDWSQSFYADEGRSGGALFDLHVHDVDIVVALFGVPAEVHASGSTQHLTACYGFDEGPRHVTAEGGWAHAAGSPFRMHFTVAFERATADFALGRDPELWIAGEGAASPAASSSSGAASGPAGPVPVAVPEGDGYQHQARHALEVVRGLRRPSVSLDQALAVTQVLERERASLRNAP